MDGFGLTWSERDAMGCDIYNPVSQRGSNLTYAGGIGYMVLDAMDSLILLGLDEEYQRAREWVATKHSFDRDGIYNTFEVSSLLSENTRTSGLYYTSWCDYGSRPFCFSDNYSCVGWTAIYVRAIWTRFAILGESRRPGRKDHANLRNAQRAPDDYGEPRSEGGRPGNE